MVTFSILMLYLLSFCFPSPLLFFLALLLNYFIFHNASLWLCENRNPWILCLFNFIPFSFSISSSLNMVGGNESFLSHYTCYGVPCGQGLSSLGVLNLIDFKIHLIVKKKKKIAINQTDIHDKPDLNLRGVKMWKTCCTVGKKNVKNKYGT